MCLLRKLAFSQKKHTVQVNLRRRGHLSNITKGGLFHVESEHDQRSTAGTTARIPPGVYASIPGEVSRPGKEVPPGVGEKSAPEGRIHSLPC